MLEVQVGFEMLAWFLHLLGCHVFEDLSANCWFGNISVPW